MPDQPRTTPHPGPDRIQAIVNARHREPLAGLLEREPVWARDFTNLAYEWRRLFSELFGTFLLVLVGSGAPVLDAATHGQIGRVAEVTAPALMVLAIILFTGAVSGAHLNGAVALSVQATRTDPLAHPEATTRPSICPVYYGSQGCLRHLPRCFDAR